MPAVTMTIATPCVVTHTAHGLTAGNMLGLATDGALLDGVNATDIYYHKSIDANSYNLSRTAQGAAKAITNLAVTFDPATDIFSAAGHPFSINDPIRLTAGTMPAGFSAGTDYFIAASNFTSGQWQLALTKGGAAVLGTTAGSAVLAHTLISTSGTQSGTHTAAEIVGKTNELIQASQNGLGQLVLANVALAVTLTVDGLVTGSRVRITQADNDALLFNLPESGGRVTVSTKYKSAMNIEVRKADASPFYKPWYGSATLVDSPQTITAIQVRED